MGGALLMWLFFAVAVAGAATLLYFGYRTESAVCAVLALLFLPYTIATHRRARMRQEWRVCLRRGHATLVLPANRARHYPTDWFEGEISYRDIRAIVRREEVYSNVAKTARQPNRAARILGPSGGPQMPSARPPGWGSPGLSRLKAGRAFLLSGQRVRHPGLRIACGPDKGPM